MDARRFDTLARALATRTTRRAAVRRLAAGAAALAGLGAGGAAAAPCRDLGANCRANADCCSRTCVQTSASRRQCAPGCSPACAGKCGGAADGCGGTCNGGCGAGGICVGQTCVTGQGTCTAGDDYCADTSKTCNGRSDCPCRITTEGDTRCGGNAVAGTCGECGSTAECVAQYPTVLGVFCVRGGTGCCNGTAPRGLCVHPCPS